MHETSISCVNIKKEWDIVGARQLEEIWQKN